MWAQSGARASMGTNPYTPFAASNGTPTAWGTPMSRGREGQPCNCITFTEEDAGANTRTHFYDGYRRRLAKAVLYTLVFTVYKCCYKSPLMLYYKPRSPSVQ